MEKGLLTSLFKPAHQLVIYEDRNNSYIEHFEILEIEGKHFLSEGKPLTKKTLKKIMNLVMTTDKSIFSTVHQLLPANVIYYDSRPGKLKLLWYNTPQERTVHGIYKKATKAKIPALVYKLEDDTLYIYATKIGNKRPELTTQLFNAPMPNIYEDDGNVCMGNVKKPKNTVEIAELIKSWEHAFWNSEFADHLWSDAQEKLFRKSIREKVVFPSKLLIPMKKTIKTILNEKNG